MRTSNFVLSYRLSSEASHWRRYACYVFYYKQSAQASKTATLWGPIHWQRREYLFPWQSRRTGRSIGPYDERLGSSLHECKLIYSNQTNLGV
jgi:hypothetical protein